MPKRRDRNTKRISKGWIFAAAAVALLAVLPFAAGAWLSPRARHLFIRTVERRYDSDVQLGKFRVSLFPRVSAYGEGLVLRLKSRPDMPPLASVKRFSVDAGIVTLLLKPRRISLVKLEGLEIHVPPRREQDSHDTGRANAPTEKNSAASVLVEEIIADGSRLEIIPKNPDKDPLLFEISRLRLHSVGAGRPMEFRATLTNPKPPGLIESQGQFGPWQAEEPRATPVAGNYTFEHADLSVFRGISGILSSKGHYQGVLENIVVDGDTDTPDFAVSGQPVHLRTRFHAIVDGTDGDTLLQPVSAQFERSTVIARGGVIGKKGVKGKSVILDVTVDHGRVEDLLRLAVKSKKPTLIGGISFKAKFDLPPGDRDVMDKLRLNGTFGIDSARFTSTNLQEKVAALSRRGKGKPEEPPAGEGSVASNFRGRFILRDSVITFSPVSFSVPGALVRLNGSYGIRAEALDFRGQLRLQAKVSQTTTGIKSFFLKAVDPLFARDGAGAVLPIKIGGTRSDPSFGLDVRRALLRKP